MNLLTVLAVASGGAIGATLRYLFGIAAQKIYVSYFPYSTLLINIIGSVIMGILVEMMAQRWSVSNELRAFLMVGILGGFTTFSAFSLDAVLLLERGQMLQSLFYITASVLLSIFGLWAGMMGVRFIVR